MEVNGNRAGKNVLKPVLREVGGGKKGQTINIYML